MLKKYCLISFILLCAGIGIFHQSIQLALFKWIATTYAQSSFGHPLTFEHAYLKDGQFVLQSPQLGNNKQFVAEKMTLQYLINWQARQIDLSIDLESPCWKLEEEAKTQSWHKWSTLRKTKKKWLKIHPHFRLRKGCIQHEDSSVLFFDLDANMLSGGYVKAYLNQHDKESNYLSLRLSSEAQAMRAKCECKSLECASLLALAQCLYVDLKPLHLNSGVFEGEVQAVFIDKQRPYIEGELAIHDLMFKHETAHLSGAIPQAKLKLEKNLTTTGQIEILQPASLIYQLTDQPEWMIDHLQGVIDLNGMKRAEMALSAQGHYQHHHSHFNLRGLANLNALENLNFDLHLTGSSQDRPEGLIHILLHQTADSTQVAEIELRDLSFVECGFLQRVMASYWPRLEEVELQEGSFNTCLVAQLTHQGVETIQFNSLQVKDFKFKMLPLHTFCSLKQVTGQGVMSLTAPRIWQSLSTELHLQDGYLHVEGLNPNLPLTNIQTHLAIKRGQIPHALVMLEWAGLKGAMDVEWREDKELLTLKLEGKVQDLSDFLPLGMQGGLQTHFDQDQLNIIANLKRRSGQMDLTGTLHIQPSENQNLSHLIHFGADLKKMAEYSENRFTLMGWFYAKELPLEKFVTPFVFRKDVLRMKGTAEIKGSFDHQNLTVNYDVNNLIIENDNLLIEAKQLRSTVPGQFAGFHQFDLKTHAQRGTLPLSQVSYLEKNSGLYFKDIQGKMFFKDKALHVQLAEAYCQDIYFVGSLDLDYSDPRPCTFTVSIKSPFFSGQFSHIQHVFSRFKGAAFLSHLNLEGEVEGKEQGLSLQFDFVPDDYHLQASCKGKLTNGFLPFESKDLALKEIDLDFNYQHAQECLELTDIQGALLVGKARHVQEYAFVGHHIRLTSLERQNIDVDCCIKDGGEELFRLVACTEESEEGSKQLKIDKALSHFSHIYPLKFSCQLQPSLALQALDCEAQFKLEEVLKDLRRFKQTGLLSLSSSLLSKLDHLPSLTGLATCKLCYDPEEKSYEYRLQSESVRLSEGQEHVCVLKGKKRGEHWSIDQAQWDHVNFFADVHSSSDKWRINFLGLNDGCSLVLGLEGDVYLEKGECDLKLNLCEVKGHSLTISHPLSLTIQPNGEVALNQLNFLVDGQSYYEWKNVTFKIASQQLFFSFLTHQENYPYQMMGYVSLPAFNKGEVFLKDGFSAEEPLAIHWQRREPGGFQLSRIKGRFCGLKCNLEAKVLDEAQAMDWMLLQGKVEVDVKHLNPLLSSSLAENIQKLKLGSLYQLQGHYWINPSLGSSLWDKIFFKGNVSSQSAEIKGYVIDRLEAEADYQSKKLTLNNLMVRDPAGTLHCPQATLFEKQDTQKWTFLIPQLTVKQFKPSLLREIEPTDLPTSSRFKTLEIKRIDVNHFSGNLKEVYTWQGEGRLHFLNPSRKNIAHHPLLAIPAEIILRLGLDPQVLNPVTGTLYFHLQGDRFYFKRFKDVYSEGRGSKFYLARGSEPSWMDMEGNLSLQIETKQYNLFFKLAELFTVSVKGNLKKPLYTLQQQRKRKNIVAY